MKLNLFNAPCLLILAAAFIMASCSKEGPAGATGPAGPQGPAGAAGSAGANGTAGAAGAAGTANVIYSGWLDVTYSGTDSTGWTGRITATKLVDSIINKGDIKVYLNVGSDSANNQLVVPLPIYDRFVTNDIITAYFSSQTITLAALSDESSFIVRGYHYYQYRYILIPGGTKSGRYNNAINWNDYKQVKAYLGLKD